MSSINMALVDAYLANVKMALENQDLAHATTLLDRVRELLTPSYIPSPLPPVLLSIGVGLDAGVKRRGKPNEDFVFGTTGINEKDHSTYGLFIVCDGMGGHANGSLASRRAVQAIVEAMVPYLHTEKVLSSHLGAVLEQAVEYANGCIYDANRGESNPRYQMGTTMTVAVTFGPHAFIANVGDSRTYLYRRGKGLRLVSRDHSHVADMVASGELAKDAVYTHPQRNLIYRCLGEETVEVDIFHEILQDGDVLLLCSDGLWEMTRDEKIEQVLGSSLSSSEMTDELVDLALQGGGADNISCLTCRCRMEDVAEMQTVLISLDPSILVGA